MSETVGGTTPFASGGHTWLWGDRATFDKVLTAVAVQGASVLHTLDGPCPVQIVGLLKASGANEAAADLALDAQEQAVEDLIRGGQVLPWEDDRGRSGEALRIQRYSRVGPRSYGRAGSSPAAWQRYRVEALELDGGPF